MSIFREFWFIYVPIFIILLQPRHIFYLGARCSSVVRAFAHGAHRSLFQPVLHDWYNKGHGMVHIKEPLLLIGKSSQCSGRWMDGQTDRKEGNVLFNDSLNTFYLWLYGRGTLLPPLHGLLFLINSKGSFICTIP